MAATRVARRAFTLLEVVMAVALFAVAVVVLAAAYVNILNSLERVRADQSLEQELGFVRSQLLLAAELEAVEEGGEVPTATHGMAEWRATVAPTAVADLFRVVLEIRLEGDGGGVPARTLQQTLHLLRPGWSDPTERDALRAESRKRIEDLKLNRPR